MPAATVHLCCNGVPPFRALQKFDHSKTGERSRAAERSNSFATSGTEVPLICRARLTKAGAKEAGRSRVWNRDFPICTLKAWAEILGLQQAVRLLDETLQQEKKTDADLSEIAKDAVNMEAQAA